MYTRLNVVSLCLMSFKRSIVRLYIMRQQMGWAENIQNLIPNLHAFNSPEDVHWIVVAIVGAWARLDLVNLFHDNFIIGASEKMCDVWNVRKSGE